MTDEPVRSILMLIMDGSEDFSNIGHFSNLFGNRSNVKN